MVPRSELSVWRSVSVLPPRHPPTTTTGVLAFSFVNLLEAPRSIVIDPMIAFGQPVLVGSNIPTRIIEGRFSAGDSFEVLAGDYDRTTDEIQEAIRWERRRAA